jgi:triacylglycerol esterase/lipase EstA (alpha/beta hydrolase family)
LVLTQLLQAGVASDSPPSNGESVAVLHGLARTSKGGVVVRQLAKTEADLRIARVVMLSPPNHGSEVVDSLGTLSLLL